MTSEECGLFDYSDARAREQTAAELFARARSARGEVERQWERYDDYYKNRHTTGREIAEAMERAEIPWIPACLTDPWVHVETQIDPETPQFEFCGRDDDLDSRRAKQREYVVRSICDYNRIAYKNTANERRLGKYGNAFWKVYFDAAAESACPGKKGEILISDVEPAFIYPDPGAVSVEECEYIDYCYPCHRQRVKRIFEAEIKKLGLTVDALVGGEASDFFDFCEAGEEGNTVWVLEHWYRDDEGDIACSIIIGGREIRHIPKYWHKTRKQNKSYPFVKYCRIRNERSFWDYSELFPIMELVDAADRELAYGLVNDAFTSNDIIVKEENALADGCVLENRPGAVVEVRPGQINGIKRLGGLPGSINKIAIIQMLQQQIERTVGNYDSSMGKEPVKVTTATGISLLNERADMRRQIKTADRLNGFERLYELTDMTALEFYDDDRVIFIGAAGDGEPVVFNYNSERMRNAGGYFPRIDTKVHAAAGSRRSRAMTISTLEMLMQMPVNADNFPLVRALLDTMDIPQRQEIVGYLEEKFANREDEDGILRQLLADASGAEKLQ